MIKSIHPFLSKKASLSPEAHKQYISSIVNYQLSIINSFVGWANTKFISPLNFRRKKKSIGTKTLTDCCASMPKEKLVESALLPTKLFKKQSAGYLFYSWQFFYWLLCISFRVFLKRRLLKKRKIRRLQHSLRSRPLLTAQKNAIGTNCVSLVLRFFSKEQLYRAKTFNIILPYCFPFLVKLSIESTGESLWRSPKTGCRKIHPFSSWSGKVRWGTNEFGRVWNPQPLGSRSTGNQENW